MEFSPRARWGPRTVMPNVAHILPPDVAPDVLHTFLLRFQLEEVEYRLAEDAALSMDVRTRDALVQERQMILASIARVFPPFQPPPSAHASARQTLAQLELPSNDAVKSIVGNRGAGLRKLEKEHNVKVTFRSATPAWEPSSTPIMTVLGNSSDSVSAFIRRVQSMLGIDAPVDMRLSFDPSTPPWADDTVAGDDVEAAMNELMQEIREPKKSPEPDDLLRRFDVDLSVRDVSCVLLEPPPLGLC